METNCQSHPLQNYSYKRVQYFWSNILRKKKAEGKWSLMCLKCDSKTTSRVISFCPLTAISMPHKAILSFTLTLSRESQHLHSTPSSPSKENILHYEPAEIVDIALPALQNAGIELIEWGALLQRRMSVPVFVNVYFLILFCSLIFLSLTSLFPPWQDFSYLVRDDGLDGA